MNKVHVRAPLRIKITLPYAFLALLLLLSASYLVSRLVFDTLDERFTNQLIDAGKITTDRLVQREAALLESVRLIARLEGMAEAVAAGDAERIRALALPVTVNARLESVEILDAQGVSLAALRRAPESPPEAYASSRGETAYQTWPFVQKVLRQETDGLGDKYAGLAEAPWGDYFYIAGPIYDGGGQLQGAVLVGASLQTLARSLYESTLAHATLYRLDGSLLTSTLFVQPTETPAFGPGQVGEILSGQDRASLMRDLSLSGRDYREILAPFEARDGADLGLVGIALPKSFLVTARPNTRIQVTGLVLLAFLLIILVGVAIARRITRPLLAVVQATAAVAEGNLSVEVSEAGDDEVTVLARGFNQMVAGLREGSVYRDLLGRTVSPEVREQLRQAFETGQLRLAGQTAVATVLFADVSGFTALSETLEPVVVMEWLNEYFAAVVPLIAQRGGVVNKFDGDAVMAFFGVLPRPTPPEDSALQACLAAVEMVATVEQLNASRAAHRQLPIVTGIGINTGPLVAGGLGSADRLQYTIIGDTVNTAQRIQTITREFGETGIAVSQHTAAALPERPEAFQLAPLGARSVKGKQEKVFLYRLYGVDQSAHGAA